MVCHWIFLIQILGQNVWLQVNILTFVSEIMELLGVSNVIFLLCYSIWFSIHNFTTRYSSQNHKSLRNKLTPWRQILLAKVSSASQEIPHILWYSKVHCCFYIVHSSYYSSLATVLTNQQTNKYLLFL
jgi:hypothetical protein